MWMQVKWRGGRSKKKIKLISNRFSFFRWGWEPAGSWLSLADVGFLDCDCCHISTSPEKEQDVNHGRRRGEPKEGQRRHHPRQGLRSLLCLLHPAAWWVCTVHLSDTESFSIVARHKPHQLMPFVIYLFFAFFLSQLCCRHLLAVWLWRWVPHLPHPHFLRVLSWSYLRMHYDCDWQVVPR